MKEDRLDELIDAAARDYHRPGDVPRERMWERVQAARSTTRETPRRTRSDAIWAWAGLAAAALLTIGIGIGRWMERSTTAHTMVAATGPTPDTGARIAATAPSAQHGTPAVTQPGGTESAPAVSTQPPAAQRVATASHAERRTSRPAARMESPNDAGSLAYRAELAEHFASTEALLTSFNAAARSGHTRVDPQLASWTRDLLTTTRMLEASAPQDDPTMTRLLGDLELVLMQISEYTAGDKHRAEDARLIEQAIERHAVMTRLRTNPAGITSPGT